MTCHFVNNNTRMGLVISLCSKLKSFDQLIPPQTASNFRHLLSCGTIVHISLEGFQAIRGLKPMLKDSEYCIIR